MSTEIYYFSGTGNSLFVAKELQKRIPDSVILPIVSYLDDDVIKTEGKVIGIVFPCHALTIPLAVKAFIKKVDLKSATYIFAVATRYGTVFKGFETIARLLKREHQQLHARFILNMCHNEAPRSDRHYIVPSASDMQQIENSVLLKIEEIATIIKQQKKFHTKDDGVIVKSASNPVTSYLIERLVIFLMSISKYLGGVNYFYHDDRCTGCGICEKVCLSQKIKMVEGKPVWRKEIICHMCFACVNFCPMRAVQVKDIPSVKSYTAQNGRYPHPYAAVIDLEAQRKQVRQSNQGFERI